MTVLRVEDEGGTKTLLEEANIPVAETLQSTVRNFVIKHYDQANKTVFDGEIFTSS